MKFNNGTEFRFATPKYSRIWGGLLNVGCLLMLISYLVKHPVRDWIVDGASVILFTGLAIALVGAIAERREWQTKHQAETK